MKPITALVAISALCSVFSSIAHADAMYYVYQKDHQCNIEISDVTTEEIVDVEIQRSYYGSYWQYIGKADIRSDAEKIAEEAHCDVQPDTPFPFFFF